MGNKPVPEPAPVAYSFETTIRSCTSNYVGDLVITIDPGLQNSNSILLKRTHPRFERMYNKLKIGKSYKLVVIDHKNSIELEQIHRVKTLTITGMIKGILDLSIEQCYEYHEVILFNPKSIGYGSIITTNSVRLFLPNEYVKNITTGLEYVIKCKKFHGSNFYLIAEIGPAIGG